MYSLGVGSVIRSAESQISITVVSTTDDPSLSVSVSSSCCCCCTAPEAKMSAHALLLQISAHIVSGLTKTNVGLEIRSSLSFCFPEVSKKSVQKSCLGMNKAVIV